MSINIYITIHFLVTIYIFYYLSLSMRPPIILAIELLKYVLIYVL